MFIYLLIIIFDLFNFALCNTKNNFDNNLLHNYLINNKYKLAEKELNKIDENYLSDNDLREYLVKKLYINYKLNNLELSNKLLNNLLDLYKDYNNIDYILYMKGIINLEIDKKILSKSLYFNYFNRSNKYIYESLNYFNILVNNFKNSKYYEDSIYKIIYIKQRLFVHNLSIINFYFKRNNHISVINRSIDLLKFFPEEPYIYYLIKYIKKSCNALGLEEIDEKLNIIINSNLSKFNSLKIKFN